MELLLQQLHEDKTKIPRPSRDEIIKMATESFKNLNIDTEQAFKSLFITNDLNGSEDCLVSDRIYRIVGEEMVKFR